MNITNKTRKPLSVPLPGGKRLFLGPGKTGQVSPAALEHPGLVKLLETGELETSEGEHRSRDEGGARSGARPGGRRGAGGIVHKSGDR